MSYSGEQVELLNKHLLEEIEDDIETVIYKVLDTRNTVCELHLKNHFVVEGRTVIFSGSAVADRRFARKQAIENLLKLKRYALLETLYRESSEAIKNE